MDLLDTLIIGVAVGAASTIVANMFINGSTEGGGEPRQASYNSYTARGNNGRVKIKTPPRVGVNDAPIAQNTPITEAAYNIQPTTYSPTLGPDVNNSTNPVTLPM
jgi:hypothetical protein